MKIKKWISNIITCLLIALILTTVFLTFSAKRDGGSPKIFGYELMSVLSGSMEPSIQTGSIVLIKPVNNTKGFKKGEVITFISPEDKNKIITHRIYDVDSKDSNVQYITKGDNNDSKDPKPVPYNNIIGKYSGITVPYLGYASGFVKSKQGAIFLLIVPGVILIIWQLFNVWMMVSKLDSDDEGVVATVSSEK